MSFEDAETGDIFKEGHLYILLIYLYIYIFIYSHQTFPEKIEVYGSFLGAAKGLLQITLSAALGSNFTCLGAKRSLLQIA